MSYGTSCGMRHFVVPPGSRADEAIEIPSQAQDGDTLRFERDEHGTPVALSVWRDDVFLVARVPAKGTP